MGKVKDPYNRAKVGTVKVLVEVTLSVNDDVDVDMNDISEIGKSVSDKINDMFFDDNDISLDIPNRIADVSFDSIDYFKISPAQEKYEYLLRPY